MRERLLAYLLNDMTAAERAAVEAELAADAELQQELDKLRECLDSDSADCPIAETPPPQLASRTCCFVDHAIQKSKALRYHPPGARALSESHDPLVRRRKWSVYDIGAGICVLIALGALVMPSLQTARTDSRLIACQNNMRSIGAALAAYSYQFNNGLPSVGPGENAGVFVLTLADRGVISRQELVELLVCPSSELAERVNRGCVRLQVPSREQYAKATGIERARMRQLMAGDYAYSLGYEDAQGQIRQVHLSGSRFVPMLADAPSSAIAGYQSANHGGCGQNVLFQDLSVKYCKQCKCQEKRDHWFLNDDGQPAAGRHQDDIVLGSSAATPVIELISVK